VGLAWDAKGRLYMSSDSTGEIYVITKTDGSGIADVSQAGAGGGTPTGSVPKPSESQSMAGMTRWDGGMRRCWLAGAAVAGAALAIV
jgi:hypothetical protein